MDLIISFVSLGFALFALGWNIYKDIIQKPRFKVFFGIYDTATMPDINLNETIIMFTGVNIGTGDIVVKNIILKYKRKKPFAIVLPNMKWKKVPQRISVGDEANIITDYFKDCFLSTDFYKAGLIDSFGRKHWVSRKQIEEAKDRYQIDFKKKEI